jgi:hypothetical protein
MILIGSTCMAQSNVGDAATLEPTMLIDKPTAGLLKRGNYSVFANFYRQGGVLMGISAGVFEPFSFGISYGGEHIIGSDQIVMYPLPGVNVKLRILRESQVMPAIAVGFDSQGRDSYIENDSLSRFTIKSPGFYAALSKNFSFLGNLSFHGGVTYATEKNDPDKGVDLYLGLEKSIGPDISVLAEYDFAFNDNYLVRERGYLNIGVKAGIGGGFHLGFELKDILQNQENVNFGNRTISIDFVNAF